MFTTYIVIAIVIVVVGFSITAGIYLGDVVDEEPLIQLRFIAIATFVSWTLAILWPVLLVSAVPALFVYGIVATVRSIIHQDIDY